MKIPDEIKKYVLRTPSILLGVLLFLQALEILSITGNSYKYLLALSGMHLITTYFYREIITPEVKSPLCPFCKGYMITVTLKCRDCGRTTA